MLIAELVAPKRRNLKNAVPPVKVAAKRKNAIQVTKNVIPRKSNVIAKIPKSPSAAQLINTNSILLLTTAQNVATTLGCFFVFLFR